MESEYIIVNKTAIQKRIEELEIEKQKNPYSAYYTQPINIQINTLRRILSQSTPLIPEIEGAFDESRRQHSWAGGHLYGNGYNEEEDLTDFKYKSSQDYISNLKLDI